MDELLPIREAARRAGVPEETLRRAVVMGELDAVPVPDDRDYLVQLSHVIPRESGVAIRDPKLLPRPLAWCLFIMWVSGVLVLGSCFVITRQYACVNCNAEQRAMEFFVIPFSSQTKPGYLTAEIQRFYPEPCDHEWVFLTGRWTFYGG